MRLLLATLMIMAPLGCQPLTVGYSLFELPSGQSAAVWYPSRSEAAAYAYSTKLAGVVAVNGAPVGPGAFPLVVFSHGDHGCKTQSAFFTEELARRGFVVAAVDHADANCGSVGAGTSAVAPDYRNPQDWTDATYAGRGRDVRQLIDALLADSRLGPAIDASRIAAMGHSLGGYTVFGLAGGWESWYDARVRAALLLSPYLDPYLVQGRMAAVVAPKMMQGGTLDLGITPSLRKANGAYDQALAEKFFLELRRAGHFAWTNEVCADAVTVSNCLATVTNARLMVDYGTDFLNRTLRGKTSPALVRGAPALADYRVQLR